jgi:predicted aspartyl protease
VQLEGTTNTITIDRILVDTGSAATIFQTELLASIGIVYAPDDQIHEVFGVGGSELVFQKTVPKIVCGNLQAKDFEVEVGWLDYGIAINGILGLDFLMQTGAILNLRLLEVNDETHQEPKETS